MRVAWWAIIVVVTSVSSIVTARAELDWTIANRISTARDRTILNCVWRKGLGLAATKPNPFDPGAARISVKFSESARAVLLYNDNSDMFVAPGAQVVFAADHTSLPDTRMFVVFSQTTVSFGWVHIKNGKKVSFEIDRRTLVFTHDIATVGTVKADCYKGIF